LYKEPCFPINIDDVKKQRNAEYAKHINDPVLSSLKMEGIRLLFLRKAREASYSVLRVVCGRSHRMELK
jgi:hypothetical protein